MMAYPTKILPDLLNGSNSEFVLNDYEAKDTSGCCDNKKIP